MHDNFFFWVRHAQRALALRSQNISLSEVHRLFELGCRQQSDSLTFILGRKKNAACARVPQKGYQKAEMFSCFGQRLELSNIKTDFQAWRVFHNPHYTGPSSRSAIRLDESHPVSSDGAQNSRCTTRVHNSSLLWDKLSVTIKINWLQQTKSRRFPSVAVLLVKLQYLNRKYN